MDIAKNLHEVKKTLGANVKLIAVSKTKPQELIQEAYDAGHRVFGENKAQELQGKHAALPQDIEWHFIGRLQTNKVKYIAGFVHLIHSVDSERLLAEIDKRARSNNRIIDVLIQVHIAREDSKTGFLFADAFEIVEKGVFDKYKNINIRGFMGMASNTSISTVVEEEFGKLNNLFKASQKYKSDFDILSMGMSNDYPLAIANGANMVRIGSAIFGERQYPTKE